MEEDKALVKKVDVEEENAGLRHELTEPQDFLTLCKEHEKTAGLERERFLTDREQAEEHVVPLGARSKCKKPALDLDDREAVQLQNMSKLKALLKDCREQRKIAEQGIERRKRGREEMEKSAQLVTNLISDQGQHEQEKNTIIKPTMGERATALLQKITKLQAFLKLCEKREKFAELERERMKKHVARLEATLASEREEKEKIKQHMEESTIVLLQNISGLQASLNLCEEREKTEDLERESLMRDRERLEKHVAQLEATLALEREQQEQQEKEKERILQEMEDRTNEFLRIIGGLQASLGLF